MNRPLTIAVSKGYLLEETIAILNKIGYTFSEDWKNSRKLYTEDDSKTLRLLQIRPWDAPVYVEQGAADLGVVGHDVIFEKNDKVITLVDLKFGGCRLVLAGPKKITPADFDHNIRIATKYPNSAKRYFNQKGLKAQILKLYGAIELAPLTGLSDIICDLTATGKTLKENGLHIIDTLFESTALLVTNPHAMAFHYDKIKTITQAIKKEIN